MVLSDSPRVEPNRRLLVQLEKRGAVRFFVQRVPKRAFPVVENDGPAWAQVAPAVRVGTDEHVHQHAVDVANLRRQITSRIDLHDGVCLYSHPVNAMGRSVLASGELGKHNGLPCTIIIVGLMH